MTLQEAFRKLDEVRDEFHAAKFALGRTIRAYDDDPLVHQAGRHEEITLHHLDSSAQNLQITYLLRLFAEFEDVLRNYWLNGRKRPSRPRMMELMNSVAAYCIMSNDDVQDAHEVRDYRNDVIHEHLQDPRFDFQTCRSRLARFVRWLPREW